MRRHNIQLIAKSRAGDTHSRLEAGRHYLLGTGGFPRHLKTGLDYLTHSSVAALPESACVIAECLPLEDILQQEQEAALQIAAHAGCAMAQTKLAALLCLRHGCSTEARDLLQAASAAGHESASHALDSCDPGTASIVDRLPHLLRILTESGDLDGVAVAVIVARDALAARDMSRLQPAIRSAIALTARLTDDLSELLCASFRLGEQLGLPIAGIDCRIVETALAKLASAGNRYAAHALGRALCGIAAGPHHPATLCTGPNMRRGAALLLRAADSGCDDAWLHLYRLHSDRQLSIANWQMARFCLEKAALAGRTEAQRKLGASLLSASASLGETEHALDWLYKAARSGDMYARSLLRSLVLPLEGHDDEAMWGIELIARDDPRLALRLRLSRHFGLTKLEALCIDPAPGLRPWGLVVGANPYTSQIRLSAARAIPALSAIALETATRAATFFGSDTQGSQHSEGDLRRRTLRSHRALERHGLHDRMYFANASSTLLESLRHGAKWAFREKQNLQMALAA